jgi:glucokinase
VRIAFILEEPNRGGSFTEKAKRDALLTKLPSHLIFHNCSAVISHSLG